MMADTENKEVARITFVFETICSVNCELYFMVVSFFSARWVGVVVGTSVAGLVQAAPAVRQYNGHQSL